MRESRRRRIEQQRCDLPKIRRRKPPGVTRDRDHREVEGARVWRGGESEVGGPDSVATMRRERRPHVPAASTISPKFDLGADVRRGGENVSRGLQEKRRPARIRFELHPVRDEGERPFLRAVGFGDFEHLAFSQYSAFPPTATSSL
jgi:hypothetical protein